MRKLKILVILMACVLWTGRVSADNDDIKMFKKAKIDLIEAIKKAEQHQGGKAFEAEIEDDSFNPEYEIKVLKEDKTFKVTVDGVSGNIIRVKEK